MATVRPSLYIGLGGTGILAISKAKKMFEDTFGKGSIPRQISFLAIDFDLSMDKDPHLATDIKDDFLKIENLSNPLELYQVQSKQGAYSWMFQSNDRYIPAAIVDGAGQVRTTGRFLTNMINSEITNHIISRMTLIADIQNQDEHDEANTGGIIDVHIAMSLAGGTGAGSFIEIANLIRDLYPNNARLIGYGVLHGVFRAMDTSGTKTPRVTANAYSAIMDLDYLMEASTNNIIRLEVNGTIKELKQPVYDQFYVIDNTTTNSKKVDSITKLSEVIGTCLYVASSEMGSKVQSGQSNTSWTTGNYDISPKQGWAQSLGACQVVYKGRLLAEIYALNSAQELIRKLQNKSANLQQKAQDWTSHKDVQIREDGDTYNQLIDSLHSKSKFNALRLPLLDVKDSLETVKANADKYAKNVPDFTADIKNHSERIGSELDKFIDLHLNAEHGVGNALGILNSLTAILTKYKTEMEEENTYHSKRIIDNNDNGFEVAFKKSLDTYENYLEKTFKTKKGKEERLQSIARVAHSLLKEKIEIERRKAAIDIFINTLTKIDEKQKQVDKINKILSNLFTVYSIELAQKQNTAETELVFEIDLSYEIRKEFPFDGKDVLATVFFDSIDNNLSAISSENELNEKIMSFTSSLKKAQVYRNKLIVDIIDEMSKNDPTAYAKLKKEIETKSSCLLKINNRGQVDRSQSNKSPADKMVKNFMIAIYKKQNEDGIFLQNALETDKDFLGSRKKDFIQMQYDAFKQKIIFYRSDIAVIPYCIDAFDPKVEQEYNVLIADEKLLKPHFDKHIFEAIRKKDFKLKPEMQNEAMMLWVCGHLFGWQELKENAYIMQKDSNGTPLKIEQKEEVTHKKTISVRKGKYFYWNEDGDSRGLDGKWYSLDNSNRRDAAFRYFKSTVLPKIKQTLVNKIKDDYASNGRAYYEALVDDLITDGKFDYIDKIVCSDKSSLTYFQQNSGEANLLDEEFNYIKNNLKNDLNNLN
jgi:hypothetical protein